jgi:hypothetical protein
MGECGSFAAGGDTMNEPRSSAYFLSGQCKLQLDTVSMILDTLLTGRQFKPDTLSETACDVIRSARDLLAATSARLIACDEAP